MRWIPPPRALRRRSLARRRWFPRWQEQSARRAAAVRTRAELSVRGRRRGSWRRVQMTKVAMDPSQPRDLPQPQQNPAALLHRARSARSYLDVDPSGRSCRRRGRCRRRRARPGPSGPSTLSRHAPTTHRRDWQEPQPGNRSGSTWTRIFPPGRRHTLYVPGATVHSVTLAKPET